MPSSGSTASRPNGPARAPERTPLPGRPSPLPAPHPNLTPGAGRAGRLIHLPASERVLTPLGPMRASEWALASGAGEASSPEQVCGAMYTVRTISGHEVCAAEDAVFRTTEGCSSARDLRCGDQLFLQSDHGFWNPSPELPVVVGARSSWSSALGALMGRILGSGWMRSADAGTELVLAFPKGGDPAKVQQTRGWMAELLGCASRWVGRGDELWLAAEIRGVQGLEALGLPQCLSHRDDAGRGSARLPDALFRAPEDAVHAFVRTVLEDLGSVEEQALRIEGGSAFLADLQELLSFLGVLSIRWDAALTEAGAELILPPKSVASIPPTARPEAWDVLDVLGYDRPHESPVTTVLDVVESSPSAAVSAVSIGELASMRGFLLQAS